MNAAISSERCTSSVVLPARDYNLAVTLNCGQAFRWQARDNHWIGVVNGRWVRLRAGELSVIAETAEPVPGWGWLADYLQTGIDMEKIYATFPDDEPMRASLRACRGMRLLRQDTWECLASFILSSTKQVVQIQQVVAALCERFGERIPSGSGEPAFAFPSASRIARASESELRSCRMGFRAPYLLGTARAIAGGELDPERLRGMSVDEARASLMQMPGVGRKIADCVLLFAYGVPTAFPVDVWIMRALRELYFPKRRVGLKRILRFSETYFGPYSGYAQQYLFHYMRTEWRRADNALRKKPRGKR